MGYIPNQWTICAGLDRSGVRRFGIVAYEDLDVGVIFCFTIGLWYWSVEITLEEGGGL